MKTNLTRSQLNLIWNIEVSCRRCVQGARYFTALPKAKDRRWAYTQNCFGGISIVFWCQVFGSDSEPTHYSKIFNGPDALPITRDQIAARLRRATNMTEPQYKAFWQGVKGARDKFFVHNEFDAEDRPRFPDLDIMAQTCLEMRIILREILDACISEDLKFQKRISHWIAHFTNDVFLKDVEGDLPQLKEEASADATHSQIGQS